MQSQTTALLWYISLDTQIKLTEDVDTEIISDDIITT